MEGTPDRRGEKVERKRGLKDAICFKKVELVNVVVNEDSDKPAEETDRSESRQPGS